MIEVTIAEVTLTDALTFGVEWLFKGGAPSGRGSGGNSSPVAAVQPGGPTCRQRNGGRSGARHSRKASTTSSTTPTFPGGVQAALHLLDQYGDTQGDREPASRRARQSEGDDQGRRPHPDQPADLHRHRHRRRHQRGHDDRAVHRHGRADAGDAAHQRRAASSRSRFRPRSASPARRPTPMPRRRSIRARSRRCSRCRRADDGHGRPHPRGQENTSTACRCSSRIPVLGGLFGSQVLKNNRTELVMFITPRVVESEIDLQGHHRRSAATDGRARSAVSARRAWPAAARTNDKLGDTWLARRRTAPRKRLQTRQIVCCSSATASERVIDIRGNSD